MGLTSNDWIPLISLVVTIVVTIILHIILIVIGNRSREFQRFHDVTQRILDIGNSIKDFKKKHHPLWDSAVLNQAEYISYLINHRKINFNLTADFLDTALIDYYEKILGMKEHKTELENDSDYPELKKLYPRLKEFQKDRINRIQNPQPKLVNNKNWPKMFRKIYQNRIYSFLVQIVLQLFLIGFTLLILHLFLLQNQPILGILTFILVLSVGLVCIYAFHFSNNLITRGYFIINMAVVLIFVLAMFGAVYQLPGDGFNTMLEHDQPTNLTWQDGLYFSTVTLTTLGYGDISPSGHFRIFAMAEVLIGALLVGLLIAGVSGIYNKK